MPVAPTYPGVYIEEVPSGVRTITGVATSIAAFVGRALRGPVDDPVVINGFADFERVFGGLWQDSGLGFSVRDFFANGGGQAVVVRVFAGTPPAGPPTNPPTPPDSGLATLAQDSLELVAASPGAWGNSLRARVEHVPGALAAELAKTYGLPANTGFFNLLVHDTRTGQTEEFVNLTIGEGPRQVKAVVNAQSKLVRVTAHDGTALPDAHDPLDPKKDTWKDDDLSSKVEAGDEGDDGVQIGDALVQGDAAKKEGIHALEKTDLFNLLVIPPYAPGGDPPAAVVADAIAYATRRRAIFVMDPPAAWTDTASAVAGAASLPKSENAAVYYPSLLKPNPLHQNRLEKFAPSGTVAGVIARTDVRRGVWKAPAGQEATLLGIAGLTAKLTDEENGQLNPLGINCLRIFPASGPVVWGARTLRGHDQLADQWKYLPVRRLALFIEESLYRGTQWVVFEPNDEPLWSQIRLNVGAFMHSLYRQGAFAGGSPRDAYFVKCDKETTTQDDVNKGIVNVVVGFAPLKPAEFVVIKLQQIAGQLDT